MHRQNQFGARRTEDGVAYAVRPPAREARPPVHDLLAALLLGIIEGLTEFLPVSSTGHLLIAQHWLGARSDFFNIVIQAGAILAVTLAFRRRLWELATGLHEPANRDYVAKIGVAFLVTALVGLPVRLAGWELPETVTPVACSSKLERRPCLARSASCAFGAPASR